MVINITSFENPAIESTYTADEVVIEFPNSCIDYDLIFWAQTLAKYDSIVIYELENPDNILYESPAIGSYWYGAEYEGYVEILDGEIFEFDTLPIDWPDDVNGDSVFGAWKFSARYPVPIAMKIIMNDFSVLYLAFDCEIVEKTIIIPNCWKEETKIRQKCDTIFTYKYELMFTEECVPNIFSPNGDGKNDCIELEQEFFIYNAWGGLVYHGLQWCGDDAINGVYAITIPESRYSGSITLVR